MAPVSSLSIPEWKETTYKVFTAPPRLIGSVITDLNKTRACGNLTHSLKYLDHEAKVDLNSFNSKFSRHLIDIPVSDINESFEGFTYWKDKHIFNYTPEFTASRNVLCSIMNTPFDINQRSREWTILAKLEGNVINLKPENNKIVSASLAKQNDLLKRYFFVKKPEELFRRIVTKLEQVVYGIYEVKIGNNTILYIAEIPGVKSEQIVNNLDELSAVDAVVCEVFDKTELTPNIVSYNPTLWSQSELINASLCLIGIYNSETDSIDRIKKIKKEVFNDTTKYENLWNPSSAWNFLDLFLQFVKSEVYNVAVRYRKKCVWKFKSYENNADCVTCEPLFEEIVNGVITYKPLPLDNFF